MTDSLQREEPQCRKYRTTVRSSWTAERAFEYLLDLEHFADWDPGVKRSDASRGYASPVWERRSTSRCRRPRRDLTLRYETVAVDAPRRFEVRAETSTLRSVDVITVEPETRR